MVLFVAIFVAAVVGAYVSPVRAWLGDAARVRHVVESLGAWVYPVGILGTALLVGCGVPRLLLCGVAGMTLGFWRGFLVGEIGTVLGYYGMFLFVRWGGREWALHRWPKLGKWSTLVEGQGVLGVVLLRHVPIHGTFINLGLGLSHIRHRSFLIGTAIGVISEAIPATLVGAGLGKGSAKAIGTYLAMAAVAFAVIWIVATAVLRKLKQRRGGAEAAAIATEAAMVMGSESEI